jgi:hypothetical protein
MARMWHGNPSHCHTSSEKAACLHLSHSHTAAHVHTLSQGIDDTLDKAGVPNSYGFSIIALTIGVKLATFPLSQQQVGVGCWEVAGGLLVAADSAREDRFDVHGGSYSVGKSPGAVPALPA